MCVFVYAVEHAELSVSCGHVRATDLERGGSGHREYKTDRLIAMVGLDSRRGHFTPRFRQSEPTVRFDPTVRRTED